MMTTPKKTRAFAPAPTIRVHFLPTWAQMVSVELAANATVAQAIATIRPTLDIEPSDELSLCTIDGGITLEAHVRESWAREACKQLKCREEYVERSIETSKTLKKAKLRRELAATRKRLRAVQRDLAPRGQWLDDKLNSKNKKLMRELGVADQGVVYVRIKHGAI